MEGTRSMHLVKMGVHNIIVQFVKSYYVIGNPQVVTWRHVIMSICNKTACKCGFCFSWKYQSGAFFWWFYNKDCKRGCENKPFNSAQLELMFNSAWLRRELSIAIMRGSNHQLKLWAPNWLSSKSRVTLGMSYICTNCFKQRPAHSAWNFVQIYDIPSVTLAFDDNQVGAHKVTWWLLILCSSCWALSSCWVTTSLNYYEGLKLNFYSGET